MVGPDHQADAGILKLLRGGVVVHRRDDDDGAGMIPAGHKVDDFIGGRELAVHQNGIRTCVGIGGCPPESFILSPACDQSLDPGDHAKVGILLGVFGRFDFSDKFFDAGQRLRHAVD